MRSFRFERNPKSMFMKRTLTFFFLTVFAVQLSAQSGMNNLGFESWNQGAPVGFLGTASVSENTSNPPEGGSAITIETTEVPDQSGNIVDTVGQIFLGSGNPTSTVGEAISYCPDSVTGYVKYDFSGDASEDTATIQAQVFSNGSPVAGAGIQFGGTQGSWASFTLPFQPADCGGNTPDTIDIIMASESVGLFVNTDYGTKTPGGVLEVDGLQIWNDGEAVGLEDLTQSDVDYGVHPNPASQTARFEFGQEADRIRVFDMTGRNVRTLDVGQKNGEKRMKVGDLKSGLYLYRIENEEGQELHSDKLQVGN